MEDLKLKNKRMKNFMNGQVKHPGMCITNMSQEEMENILKLLGMSEKMALSSADKEKDSETQKNEDKFHREIFEGDGEEIFGEMLDDLLFMATLMDALYGMIGYLVDGRMSNMQALTRGSRMVEQVDNVLEKWQRYAMTTEI